MSDGRYRLGREEIGILLSFARKPEAATADWIGRLERGVRRDEMLEFFVLAGLPLSTAYRIVNADPLEGRSEAAAWSDRSPRFRRAVVGLLVASGVTAAFLTVVTTQSIVDTFTVASAFLAIGVVLHRVIVRLSPGFR